MIFIIIYSILYFSSERIRKIISSILVSLTICLYIQGNFLNFGYGVLNGEDIDWNGMITKGIVTSLIWIILIIFPYCIKYLRERITKYHFFSSLIIFSIELLTLIILISGIENSLDNANLSNKDYYLDNSNMFNLSKNKNIIIFVSDTFEGTYMNQVLEKYPEYKEKLKDFTYFNNTTSTSTLTFASMPMIMTGEECQIGKNLQQNLDYCFKNTNVYKVLESNNYTSEIYTEPSLIPFNMGNCISNKVNSKILLSTKSKMQLTGNLYKMVLFRYMPHFLKKPFYMYGTEMDTTDSKNINRFSLDDVEFNNILETNGIVNNYNTNAFKIYHLNGVHTPYIVSRDIKYNSNKEYINDIPEDTRRLNQAVASLNILLNYVDELKKQNLYDNTMILFLADHGWINRYYTTLLVKTTNSNEEFKISTAPISLLEDLKPTILNTATNSKNYGKDIWDYKEGEERTRKVLNYVFTRGDNTYDILSKITIETKENANDLDAYYIANEEDVTPNKKVEGIYKFGKTIDFINNENLDLANFKGILLENIRHVSIGYTMSNTAKITLNKTNVDSDVNAVFNIKEVFFDNQDLIFEVNNTELYRETLNKSNNSQNIEFKIPKEIWNKPGNIEIKIKTPNAKLGDPSILGQETLYMSIWIDSIRFEN